MRVVVRDASMRAGWPTLQGMFDGLAGHAWGAPSTLRPRPAAVP